MEQKKVIISSKSPAAVGPYSQAIETNNLIFISGQLSLDPNDGQIVGGDIQTQTKQVMDNIAALLKDIGLSLENIIKTTIYMTNMDDFIDMNKVYGSYFPNDAPARSCVEVSRLPKGVLIEMEAIASR